MLVIVYETGTGLIPLNVAGFWQNSFIWCPGQDSLKIGQAYGGIKQDANTIKWDFQADSYAQLNGLTTTYFYVAIGERFDFVPKAVIIQEAQDNYSALMVISKEIVYPFYNNGNDIMFPYRAYNRVAFTDKEVSWYADGGDPNAAVQLNATTYYYLAIG